MNTPSVSRVPWIETAALVHACVLLIGSTWVFGGNIWWARQALSIWGTLALPLTCMIFFRARRHGSRDLGGKSWWLLPPALYAALVIASSFNPSFTAKVIEGDQLLAHTGAAHPYWPSTVSSVNSLKSLWFGSGVYLSAFNLAIALRTRRPLRFVFGLIAVNTCALAVFGTLQKLASAGFYFGAATSPNARFFSTFIYYNHWGACMVLGLGLAGAWVFYHANRLQGRDLWHSPVTGALAAVLLIATSAPVSASRAATGMAIALCGIMTAHALSKIFAARRRARLPAWPAAAGLLVLVLASVSAIGWLGSRSINERYIETRKTLATGQSIWGERMAVYRDTWDLASQKPFFGWGLDSYQAAFQLIRPRTIMAARAYEQSYATAHNDWLQSLAETGFAGTTLLVFSIVIPLSRLPRRLLSHPLVAYPLAALGLVLVYACIEFPFSNGAFVITFWILFFATLRHAELTAKISREP